MRKFKNLIELELVTVEEVKDKNGYVENKPVTNLIRAERRVFSANKRYAYSDRGYNLKEVVVVKEAHFNYQCKLVTIDGKDYNILNVKEIENDNLLLDLGVIAND